ncbi:MAG: PQQ-binding-like beta-propeller repeat protein [Actinobacteria bacterium]|nr:PQQ-binding-like beta-propeller repeat protein [Actinomycetota bacterium]
MTSAALVAAVLALPAMPALASLRAVAPPWGQLQGGPAHTGAAPEGPGPPYRQTWRFSPPEGGLSGAVIAGDVAIAVGVDAVYGVDLASGQERWTFPRAGGALAIPAVGEVDGRRLLVFTEGVGDAQTSIVALNLHTMAPAWRRPLEAFSRSGVTIDGGRVFVGDGGGRVYGLDLATGDELWPPVKGAGPIDAPPAVGDGTVYAVAQGGSTRQVQVLAIDAADGSTTWTFEPRAAGASASVPVLAYGAVIMGFGDRLVRALDAGDGAERWNSLANNLFSPVSSAAYADGAVYIADFSGGLYRIDGGSGERAWSYQFNQLVVRSSPVVSGSSVLLGLDDGRLVAVDASSGLLVWQVAPSPGLIGAIAAGTGKLVVLKGGKPGSLVAFEHAEGRLVSIPSPTKLDFGKLLPPYGLAFALVFVAVYVPATLVKRRVGSPVFEEEFPAEGEDAAEEEEPDDGEGP